MKPNILFILIDDMGWTDLGCYGSSFYETPNLDALAQRSMRFTDAYAACPVCSPTRASILTGKYPATVGVTNFIGGHTRGRLVDAPYVRYLPSEEQTLADALRAGGYATWHVGKWHLGGEDYWPEKHGFDVNVGGGHHGMPHKGYFSPWELENLEDGPEGEYLTDRLTDEAVELIERRDPNKPFFLHLSHYAVHVPIQSPLELVDKYETKQRMFGLDKRDPIEVDGPFPCEHKKDKRIARRRFQSDPAYAAMVQNLDWNLGRVFDALAREGIAEETIIVFTSDNGGLATAEGSPTCNAPLAEGKGWMYEGGTREPLLVRAPGVTDPDSLCEVPVSSPDFYPTLLDLAGVDDLPGHESEGVSFVPLLRGREELDREAIFWHYPHYGNQGGTPGASVRSGDWKLIRFFEDDRLELYNLREDIAETRNLAGENPEVHDRLYGLLSDWQQKVEAEFPEPNPDYEETR